jgi:hypothetical protein
MKREAGEGRDVNHGQRTAKACRTARQEKVASMELPAWVEELWIELRFKQLVLQEPDIGYQRLFQRVMKAVDGDDFVDVRPAGRGGDLKCDRLRALHVEVTGHGASQG